MRRCFPRRLPARHAASILIGLGLLVALGAWIRIRGPLPFDPPILAFLAAHRTPLLDDLFRMVTWAGSGYVLVPVVAAEVMAALRRGWLQDAVRLGVGFVGASVLNVVVKLVLAAERPDLHPLVWQPGVGFSFPSGHTTQIGAFALSTYLVVRRRYPALQLAAGTLLATLVAAVGASRLYLQVHHPSDVIGSLLLVLVWVVALDAHLARPRAPSGP